MDRKGISRKELADLTDYDYKTISAYVITERPLSKEFLEKAALALECSVEEIEAPPPALSVLKEEDALPYGSRSIPLEVIPDGRLAQIKSDLAQQIPRTSGRQFGMLMEALRAVGLEMDRRGLKPEAANSNLTSDEAAAAAAVIRSEEREHAESAGKPPRPEAGDPAGNKGGKPAPSSRPSRVEPPAPGGKAQK